MPTGNVKVKVAQLCPTLCDSMEYSPWNSPGQNTGVGSLSLLHGIFPTQRSNPDLPHCRQILHQLRHKGFPDSSAGKESTCNVGDPSSIPGLGRSPGEGMGYPLQYSWASLVSVLGPQLPDSLGLSTCASVEITSLCQQHPACSPLPFYLLYWTNLPNFNINRNSFVEASAVCVFGYSVVSDSLWPSGL